MHRVAANNVKILDATHHLQVHGNLWRFWGQREEVAMHEHYGQVVLVALVVVLDFNFFNTYYSDRN